MEQLRIETPAQLATYAREKRRYLDILLRGGLQTLPASRYTALACTQMEYARGWLGKVLGSLPDNPHPYPASFNPGSTVVAPATDRATPEEADRFWCSDESTTNARIRRLRRALGDLTQEMGKLLEELTDSSIIADAIGPNGLYPADGLIWCLAGLHEVSMSLGFELERLAAQPT